MRQTYGVLVLLSSFAVLFFASVTVGDLHAGVFLQLCNNSSDWDLTFREGRTPVYDLTPEQIKSDLMKFASVYQSESQIWVTADMIIALVILFFSIVGWIRERGFEKQRGDPSA